MATLRKMSPQKYYPVFARVNTGPVCIRAKINSPRIFSCIYWFCAGGMLILLSAENRRETLFWFRNLKLERNADNLGRDFLLGGGLKRWKRSPENLRENLLEDSLGNLRATLSKFAQPKIKITANPLCRTSGSTLSAMPFFSKSVHSAAKMWGMERWWMDSPNFSP